MKDWILINILNFFKQHLSPFEDCSNNKEQGTLSHSKQKLYYLPSSDYLEPMTNDEVLARQRIRA